MRKNLIVAEYPLQNIGQPSYFSMVTRPNKWSLDTNTWRDYLQNI